MSIAVDTDRCTGHARCNWLAPELMMPDGEGRAVPPGRPGPAHRVEDARAVRGNCPEGATSLRATEEDSR